MGHVEEAIRQQCCRVTGADSRHKRRFCPSSVASTTFSPTTSLIEVITTVRWKLTIVAAAMIIVGLVLALFAVVYQPEAIPAATEPARTSAKIRPAAASNPPASPVRPIRAARVQAYGDLIHSLSGFENVSLSDTRLPLNQLARIKFPYHAIVCSRGDLWVSHPESHDIRVIMPTVLQRQFHVSRQRVYFVHWERHGSTSFARPIFRDNDGSLRILTDPSTSNTVVLGRTDYHWDKAIDTDDAVIVPCDHGVAMIRPASAPMETYRGLNANSVVLPRIARMASGFIAWDPATRPDAQGGNTVRFTGLRFDEDFDKGEWAGPFVHLIPFADGSILQIRPTGDGTVSLNIVALDIVKASPEKVQALVTDLADDDPETRDRAHEQLADMGPAAWTILESLLSVQPPEAQLRIREIVRARTEPTLGRFKMLDNRLRPVWSLRDGGVVFLAEGGVVPANGDAKEQPIVPAWLAVRPGHPISLLPPALAKTLAIGSVELEAVNANDWVVSDETDGARLFFGQQLVPLTSAKDRNYRKALATDRAGRMLLTTADATPENPDYLLIDPMVPDPAPMIQVWTMRVPEGEVGWDTRGFPAIKRDKAWVLTRDQWTKIEGELQQTPPAPVTSQPDPKQKALLLLGKLGDDSSLWDDGQRFALEVAGKKVSQARPANLPSAQIAALVNKNQLYILHPDGRLSVLQVDPSKPAPVSLQATFVNAPKLEDAKRMWIDPAGRLCVITPDNQLIIFFIDGRIPAAIIDLIPTDELKQIKPQNAETEDTEAK